MFVALETLGCTKKWKDASLRTRESRASKAKESVMAALNVVPPGDGGPLWDTLKASQLVEAALGTPKESPEEKKYLEAFAETYYNASSWGTLRPILTVMVDITTLEKLQGYIPRSHQLSIQRGKKAQNPVWARCSTAHGKESTTARQTCTTKKVGLVHHIPSHRDVTHYQVIHYGDVTGYHSLVRYIGGSMDCWLGGSMDRSFSGLMDPWFDGSMGR